MGNSSLDLVLVVIRDEEEFGLVLVYALVKRLCFDFDVGG